MSLAVIYLYRIINFIINLYSYAILARVLLSWIMPTSSGAGLYRFYEIIYKITEPPLSLVRNLIYRLFPGARMFPVDFSPIVLFFIINNMLLPIIRMLLALLLPNI